MERSQLEVKISIGNRKTTCLPSQNENFFFFSSDIPAEFWKFIFAVINIFKWYNLNPFDFKLDASTLAV